MFNAVNALFRVGGRARVLMGNLWDEMARARAKWFVGTHCSVQNIDCACPGSCENLIHIPEN